MYSHKILSGIATRINIRPVVFCTSTALEKKEKEETMALMRDTTPSTKYLWDLGRKIWALWSQTLFYNVTAMKSPNSQTVAPLLMNSLMQQLFSDRY